MPDNEEHLVRPRISALVAQAIKKPLTIVCAGMGCGKTRAIHDFTRECAIPLVLWLQFSDSDNDVTHFWETFVRFVAKTSKPLAGELKALGFPDTADKLHMCLDVTDRMQPDTRRLFVFDDVHLVHNAAVLGIIELLLNNAPKSLSVILISRELPQINITRMMARGDASMLGEEELNFTKSELHHFLLQQGLSDETGSLSQMYEDTKGWAFLIHFVARLLKKTPGYAGCARSALQQDIPRLLETEVWNVISERLRGLFLRLALTDHRSLELVNMLAGGDESLIAELQQQNAFVRFDRYTDSCCIHHLFLDFLHTKLALLTAGEKLQTFTTIAAWCMKNDFIVDALLNYEKTGDYETIVSVLFGSPPDFFKNAARHIAGIFDRAPKEVFDSVELSAAMHVYITVRQDKLQEALGLIRQYEAKYLRLPAGSPFRNRMLGCLYYSWGIIRMMTCALDDCYDFDTPFFKLHEHLQAAPLSVTPKCWYQHPPTLWTCLAGSAGADAPQQYLNALSETARWVQNSVNGLAAGMDDLCRGEFSFYQGDLPEAEAHLAKAMENALAYGQHEIAARALFLIMRIAVAQGDRAQLVQAMRDMEKQLAHADYSVRFWVYDTVIAWYYYILGRPERMPEWLKEKFTFRLYATIRENFGNYIKAKFCYMTKNYKKLLEYLEKNKQHEVILLARVEALAMEACVHYKMNDQHAALRVLQKAHEMALPHGIVMPFIELGKDMRTLVAVAANDPKCAIPRPWLKNIKQRATVYFRNQSRITAEEKKTRGPVFFGSAEA